MTGKYTYARTRSIKRYTNDQLITSASEQNDNHNHHEDKKQVPAGRLAAPETRSRTHKRHGKTNRRRQKHDPRQYVDVREQITVKAVLGATRLSARLARSTVSGSSAGTNVAADATQESMYWQCNFGLFRGLPGVPGGKIEIVEEEFTGRLWSPSALLFRHVLHSKLLKPTEGLSNNCMVAVQKGSLLAYYFIIQGEEDNGSVGNIGYNTRLATRSGRARRSPKRNGTC